MSFEPVPHEGIQEGPSKTGLVMSETEEGSLIAERKVFFVLETRWNCVLLVRNLHGTGPRIKV